MNKSKLGYIGGALLVVIVLVFGWLGVKLPAPPMPDPLDAESRGLYATLCYKPEGGASFECDSGGSYNVNTGAALVVDSGGTLTASPGATVSLGNLKLTAADITPTAGQTITPAYGMYVVNSSGAVSMTLAAPAAAGQILYLYGDDANTVTVNDTNIRSTDGNAVTFGQYDLVEFVSSATEWIHLAKSANQ